jgi:hypothetical protein
MPNHLGNQTCMSGNYSATNLRISLILNGNKFRQQGTATTRQQTTTTFRILLILKGNNLLPSRQQPQKPVRQQPPFFRRGLCQALLPTNGGRMTRNAQG